MPKIRFSTLRLALIIILLILASLVGGYLLGVNGYKATLSQGPKVTISRQIPANRADVDFSLFWKVWDTLEMSYFDKSKIKPAEMVYGAIGGLVSALGDPYTVFLSPEENKVVQEDLNGSFEGVGIQIGFKGTQLAVIAPLPGSPAEGAGVKAGDFIVGIKDESKDLDRGTLGISLPEAVRAIRGPKGTKVTLILLREGEDEPKTVEITRARLDVPSLILTYIGENGEIAHIKLLKFGGETEGEWAKAVREITKKGNVKAVILDLRNNPGGYLQGAVDIASEFLKVGSLAVIEEKGGVRKETKITRSGAFVDTAIVIIVNKGSASASEILAGALRDERRLKIVGEKTFGKGTIQEPQQLEGGAGLHITVARWLTPKGFWVNETGLEPDVKIEDNPQTVEDEQLQEAIKLISND